MELNYLDSVLHNNIATDFHSTLFLQLLVDSLN